MDKRPSAGTELAPPGARLAAMNPLRAALLVGLILATGAAACSGAAGASPTPPAPTGDRDGPDPTAVPGGVDGSVPPDAGVIGGGVPGGADGGPQWVVPRPGTIDPHPVAVETLEARVDGRAVVVVATWWSGVEPCNVLDSVEVLRNGNDFTIGITEGAGDADAICIELAVQKATSIELGELEPGTYTVAAPNGSAAPVTFTVP